MKNLLDVISRETRDIEKEAAIAAQAHFVAGRRWEKTNLGLGIPSTILAGVAGVTAFTALSPYITGCVALIVAALSGLSTFLGPGDRADSHRAASARFSEIRREASLLRDVDAPLANSDDEETAQALADRLRQLITRITEADQHAPGVSIYAKDQAEKKFGGQFVEAAQPASS